MHLPPWWTYPTIFFSIPLASMEAKESFGFAFLSRLFVAKPTCKLYDLTTWTFRTLLSPVLRQSCQTWSKIHKKLKNVQSFPRFGLARNQTRLYFAKGPGSEDLRIYPWIVLLSISRIGGIKSCSRLITSASSNQYRASVDDTDPDWHCILMQYSAWLGATTRECWRNCSRMLHRFVIRELWWIARLRSGGKAG